MITLARFSAESILPLIGQGKPPIKLDGHWVKASSTRLECFRRNQRCATCHCLGSLFLLQHHVMGTTHRTSCFIENCEWCAFAPHKERSNDTPHLNFYHVAKRGLILMTQDHIMPKSRGGSNSLENLQTMCSRCNQSKGNKIPSRISQS